MTETREDNGTVRYEKGSPVQMITDRLFHAGDSEFLLKVLRRLGYRFLEREPALRGSRWVRPLPLWVLHWAGIHVFRAWWGGIEWLYRHGVLRLACDEGVMVRLIDLRPWPLPGRKYDA